MNGNKSIINVTTFTEAIAFSLGVTADQVGDVTFGYAGDPTDPPDFTRSVHRSRYSPNLICKASITYWNTPLPDNTMIDNAFNMTSSVQLYFTNLNATIVSVSIHSRTDLTFLSSLLP
jgi:hypothetical protein